MALSPIQDPLLQAVPIIDGYKVLEPAVLVEKLPEGGMAAVYRGLHLDLKVDVAVKVLKRTGAEGYSPQSVARFRQEAEQAARLNDPNLVRIYDFPANKIGLLYLVMEYIDGETLESRVQRRGRLNPHETVTIAYHAARGLEAAHSENVIHRDIKPPNILLSKKGQVKVTDLGIAKATDSAAMGMTQEITLLGTPQYMAPELWRGARFASPASDVFAMGATIAFMLTGRHVLDGADTQEIMHRILTQGFPEITTLAPGVPPPLANIVRLCTAPNPKERVAVNDLIMLLRELLDVFNGEFSLADPNAGNTVQPLKTGKLPSRSDLARIREQLEQIKVPTPIPGTLRVRDDPATVVAQAAAQGRVDLFGMNGAPPTQAFVRPRGRPMKKSGGAGRVLVVLFVLALLGGGGWFAWQQGWLNGNTQSADGNGGGGNGGGGTTKPAKPPPEPQEGDDEKGHYKIIAGNKVYDTPPPPPTRPAIPEEGTDEKGHWRMIAGQKVYDRPPTPPTRPAVPDEGTDEKGHWRMIAGQKVYDKPIVVPPPPPTLTAYEQARKRIADAAAQGNWENVLSMLKETWNQAEAEGKRPDAIEVIDQALMKFRAENRDLGLRRTAFPTLMQLVPYVAEEGRSGAAALVAAEALLSIDGKGAGRRLRSLDADQGFAPAVRYLDRAKAGAHVGARSDADDYLFDARLGQVEFLATKTRWKDLIEWLEELPLVSLRAAAATDPKVSLKLTHCVEVVTAQLTALWQANQDPAKVQAVSKDIERVLTPYADMGVQVASLLIAESYIAVDAKGNVVIKEGAAEKAVSMLEKARAGKDDARIAAAATTLLLDTYASAAQAQAERKAWGEMIATLGKSQALIAGTASGPQKQQLEQRWRESADRSVTELRKENANLDKRRADFPNLPADLKPLADAGLFSAKLALAESSIGYDGEPQRAAPRGGDTEFVNALQNLGACISSPECPADIKTAALSLEWDIFAAFARREGEARPVNPSRLKEALQRLLKCGGMSTRQADYVALVDQVVKPENAAMRVSLAEDQLGVQEDDKGLRQISQRDPTILTAIKKTLEGARTSNMADVKARANALIGEIAWDEAVQKKGDPQSLVESYQAYKLAYDAQKDKTIRDPVAALGLAKFYQFSNEKLAPLAQLDPAFQAIQKLSTRERESWTIRMYREAAATGDKFGNFLAGEYQYLAFERTPENLDLAEKFLRAAIAKGHKQAAVWLARVKSGK